MNHPDEEKLKSETTASYGSGDSIPPYPYHDAYRSAGYVPPSPPMTPVGPGCGPLCREAGRCVNWGGGGCAAAAERYTGRDYQGRAEVVPDAYRSLIEVPEVTRNPPGWCWNHPKHAQEMINDGSPPRNVLDAWEVWLEDARSMARNSYESDLVGSSREPELRAQLDAVLAVAAEDERHLEAARARLAEVEAELEAERVAADLAAAELAEERRRQGEEARRIWEAERPAREAAAAELRRIAAEAAAEYRKLCLAGIKPLPGTWWGHLVWLQRTFGDRSFSTRAVCEKFDDPDKALPHEFSGTLLDAGAARQLGMLYAEVQRGNFDGAHIEPGGLSRGSRRWVVFVKDV